MTTAVEVTLMLAATLEDGRSVGRLVATVSPPDGEERWSAEATLYERARTGEIARGRTVVQPSVPEDARRELEHAIARAWHRGGDIRITNADGKLLNHDEVLTSLRALLHRPAPRDTRRS